MNCVKKCLLRNSFIFIYCFFGFSTQLHAADTLIISDKQDVYPLAQYFSILEDPSNELSIEDVRQNKFANRFSKFINTNQRLGFSSSTFWLRLNVINNSGKTEKWLLQHNYSNTQSIDAFFEFNNYKIQRSGTSIPLALRSMPLREIVFSADLTTNKQQTFYIRIQSQGVINLDIDLLEQQTFIKNN